MKSNQTAKIDEEQQNLIFFFFLCRYHQYLAMCTKKKFASQHTVVADVLIDFCSIGEG